MANLPSDPNERDVLLRAVAAGNAVTVGHEGSERVFLAKAGYALLEFLPEAALEYAETIRNAARAAVPGQDVIFRRNGNVVLSVPPAVAVAIASALIANAKLAQEKRPKTAEAIAVDSAILLRAGSNFGLSNNPKILGMAKTEAESNRDLRRFMLGGIRSTEILGTPGVRHAKAPTAAELAAEFANLPPLLPKE